MSNQELLIDALKETRAAITVWRADVTDGLKPLMESLDAAAVVVRHALASVEGKPFDVETELARLHPTFAAVIRQHFQRHAAPALSLAEKGE